MKRSEIKPSKILAVLTTAAIVLFTAENPRFATAGDEAADIISTSGVKGGLVVHLGCGDGKFTARLRAGDGYLVHGLDTDAANVEKAREHIRSLGLYGRVSVANWSGGRLPYAENLVNLLEAPRHGAFFDPKWFNRSFFQNFPGLRPDESKWRVRVPLRPVAMVLAGERLLLAGPPDLQDPDEALWAIDGRKGSLLWVLSSESGRKQAEYRLESIPVLHGMAVAGGSLYVSCADGKVVCLASTDP